ncbi:MAG: transglycosylase domain-containing protein [Streptosporangiaceae bacterium]
MSNPDLSGPYWPDSGRAGVRTGDWRAQGDPSDNPASLRPPQHSRPADYDQPGGREQGPARGGREAGSREARGRAAGRGAARSRRAPAGPPDDWSASAVPAEPRRGRRAADDGWDAAADRGRGARWPGLRDGAGTGSSADRRGSDSGGPAVQQLRDRLGLQGPAGPAGPRSAARAAGRPAQRPAGRGGGQRGRASYDSYGDAAASGGTLQRDRREYGPGPGRSAGADPRRPGSHGPGGGSGGGRGGGRGSDRGQGFRHWLLHGRWWRHWTWKKAIMVALGTAASFAVLVLAAVTYEYSSTPIPSSVSEAAQEQSSNVYFSNGKTLVGTFSQGTNRQILTSSQIPDDLKQAVVAAEDRHFYTEGGISPTGIVRAAYEDVSGGEFQGGSTITQQFVRNYYAGIGTEQTASRKIREIFVAVKLAHEKSKDWILTQYLNTVYLGDHAYGVGAAAQVYFNEPAAQLNIAQSAMIAAMINQPGYFDPDPHAGAPYQALVSRWQYVLTNMVRDGAITQKQASAQKFPKIIPGLLDNGWTGYRGYIMESVLNELENTYGFTDQQVYTKGLRIVTTFNESMMNALNRAVDQNLELMRADGQPLPSWANVGAVLEQPGTGAILAMYPGKSFSAEHQWNEATQAREQVGSSFKPYVLSTAVNEGMDVQTSQLDGNGPLCVPTDEYPTTPSILPVNGSCPPSQYGYYKVNNDTEGDFGPVSVVTASAASINSAYTDLWHRVGGQNVLNMAQSFGVNLPATGLVPTKNNPGMLHEAGMALGQGSLTVEEQTTMFATLADNGEYYTPHVIAHLSEGAEQIPLKISQNHVFSRPNAAADVDYALSFDDQPGGTAYPAAAWDRPIIAKTGTTNTAQSAFFIGAIPQYALGVAIFGPQNVSSDTLDILPSLNGQGGGFGGTWPATIWHTFMSTEFASLPVEQLPTPNYNGYAQWTQVQPAPVVRHTHAQPSPSCTPFPGNPCSPGGGSPSPAPTPTVPTFGPPNPSPTCTPSPGQPCLPGPPQTGGAAATAAALTPAAEEAARARARTG